MVELVNNRWCNPEHVAMKERICTQKKRGVFREGYKGGVQKKAVKKAPAEQHKRCVIRGFKVKGDVPPLPPATETSHPTCTLSHLHDVTLHLISQLILNKN